MDIKTPMPRIILPSKEGTDTIEKSKSNITFEATDKTNLPAEDLLWDPVPPSKKFDPYDHKYLNAGWKYIRAHRSHPIWMLMADVLIAFFIIRLSLGPAGAADLISNSLQNFVHNKIVIGVGTFFALIYVIPFILDPVSDALQPHSSK